MTPAADLRRGDRGEAVRDLQVRLARAGHDVPADELGTFGEATEAAVRAFQDGRGLVVDGVCGRQTWGSLVESGFTLGDRLLYFRASLLRGDDVADLQQRLNALGFDAGREDGILGEQTAEAIAEFQRNAGLAVDGICGPTTVEALRRLGSLAGGSVASVREREALRHGPRDLRGRRVYVLVAPGLEALGDSVSRSLVAAGAQALLDTTSGDDSDAATAANRFEADLFVALRLATGRDRGCSYFTSGTFRSEEGYRVASSVQHELAEFLPDGAQPLGKKYALLRETRMAAVVCDLVEPGDVLAMREVVARAGDVGRAIVQGIQRGYAAPEDDA